MSNRPRLVILGDPPEEGGETIQSLRKITRLRIARRREEARLLLAEAEAVVLGSHAGPWLEEHWEEAKRLRWVQAASTGVDDVLFPRLRQSSVLLTNSRGAYAQPLAEFVLFCVLFFAKSFPAMERNRRERRWESYPAEEVAGQTMGIVGLGTTGCATAHLAKAMGMRVMAMRRLPKRAESPVPVDRLLPPRHLKALLRDADCVVNTLPLTSQTRGLFDEAAFRTMRPGAIFINVGRGGTVHEQALVRALRQGWIRGAGLDVFETEPLPAESELYALPNVIVSPHCADLTAAALRRVADLVLDNVRRFVSGRPLLNPVDKEAGY